MWWVGAHGGAGESTLEDLFSGSRAAGHCWPMSAAGLAPADVVLVARTHARGLEAAQLAMRQWAFPGFVEVRLLGLVLIADAPGRLPRPLRDLADHIKGGAPRVWWVPWVEAWRLGEPPGPHNAPTSVNRLLEDLRDLVAEGSSTGRARSGDRGRRRSPGWPMTGPEPGCASRRRDLGRRSRATSSASCPVGGYLN